MLLEFKCLLFGFLPLSTLTSRKLDGLCLHSYLITHSSPAALRNQSLNNHFTSLYRRRSAISFEVADYEGLNRYVYPHAIVESATDGFAKQEEQQVQDQHHDLAAFVTAVMAGEVEPEPEPGR